VQVIADGIMVSGFHLVIDEASLTGESDPIKKNPEEDPWCRSGTQVRAGLTVCKLATSSCARSWCQESTGALNGPLKHQE